MTSEASNGKRTRKVYSRAPITEAVIDIQVFSASPPDLSLLTQCADEIKEAFPTRLPLNVIRMSMEAKDGQFAQLPTSQAQSGWRLSNATNDRVLQIQQNAFTYSHMAPYTQWEVFQGEARKAWSKYLAAVQPEKITRIATRYINRFVIPTQPIQLEDYFNISPRAPDSMGVMSAFLVQIQVAQPDIGMGGQAVITMGPNVLPGSPPTPTIMLDIDVSSSEPDVGPNDPKLWDLLEKLRDKKNELFESSISDRARESIL